jgi:hypothetical protein
VIIIAKEERKKQEKTKPDSIKLITEILPPEIVEKREFLWQEIVTAMVDITKTQTKEAEEILVNLLEFDGQIRLAPQSDIPGLMSPEDILKSLAIQFLSEWTGRKHLMAFEKLAGTTESITLAEIAKIHIEILGRLPFVIANCAEGLGLFDQECKGKEGNGYPVIDKQVLYEGKPTCKAIDMCGIQAHAGYYMIGSGGKEFEFDIDEYPILYLTMKAEKDTDTCLLLVLHDKEPKGYMRGSIAVGKTPSGNCGCTLAKDYFTIKDDNEWHDYTYDLRKLRGDYPDAKTARMVQFYSGKLCNGIQHVFHFSSLVFKK